MRNQPSRRANAVQIESLESRTLFSAMLHSALIADARTKAPATTTTLKVKGGVLGQAQTFTVTERNTGSGGAPAGTVALTVDGDAFQSLTLTAKNQTTATATYVIPAGAGGTPFFFGKHAIVADYTSSNSLPASTASGTFTVKQPHFKIETAGLGVATIAKGHGAGINPGQTASMLYTGFLESNGAIFDYSDAHGGTPFTFTVAANPEQVIAGFDEGAVGMKVGSTRVLQIPSSLGYGAQGHGQSIPPNSELVFLITLEGIS